MKIIDTHFHYLPLHVDKNTVMENMDKEGIEVIFALPCPDHVRYSLKGLTGTNEVVAEFAAEFPDRVVCGVYVDPRNVMEAQTTVLRAYDRGARVVKMWPAHGFSPDDPQIYPVWEVINKLKMAVVFHSGILGRLRSGELEIIRSAGFNSKFGQPILCEQPARFFPDINFIFAHTAYPWTLEVFDLSWAFENVYVDFSCPLAVEGYNLLQKIAPKRVCFDRFLYATDTAGDFSRELDTWRKLADTEPLKAHAENFFYNNAYKLLEKIRWERLSNLT